MYMSVGSLKPIITFQNIPSTYSLKMRILERREVWIGAEHMLCWRIYFKSKLLCEILVK